MAKAAETASLAVLTSRRSPVVYVHATRTPLGTSTRRAGQVGPAHRSRSQRGCTRRRSTRSVAGAFVRGREHGPVVGQLAPGRLLEQVRVQEPQGQVFGALSVGALLIRRRRLRRRSGDHPVRRYAVRSSRSWRASTQAVKDSGPLRWCPRCPPWSVCRSTAPRMSARAVPKGWHGRRRRRPHPGGSAFVLRQTSKSASAAAGRRGERSSAARAG